MMTTANSYILTFDYNCYHGLVMNNNTINRVLEEISHRVSTNKTNKSYYFQELTINSRFPRLSWFLSLEVFAKGTKTLLFLEVNMSYKLPEYFITISAMFNVQHCYILVLNCLLKLKQAGIYSLYLPEGGLSSPNPRGGGGGCPHQTPVGGREGGVPPRKCDKHLHTIAGLSLSNR